MSTESPAALAPRRAWLALAALSLGFFMTLLDQAVVAVALPEIAGAFGVPVSVTVWVSSAYLLAVAGPLLVTGRLGDRVGQRRMEITGLAVFTVGALASALAPGLGWLILARVLQGLGAGILMPQAMAVINQIFPRERRGTALGVWGIVGSLASLVGPVIGGGVVDLFGWRGVFLMHVPVGLLAIALVLAWVPRLDTTDAEIDATSSALITLAVLATVAVIDGAVNGLPVGGVALAAVLALVSAVAFGRRQAVLDDPLFPSSLLRKQNFVAATAAIVTMGFSASSFMIPTMVWLQDGLELSPGAAGVAVAPMAAISLLLGPLAGVLADRLDPRLLSVVGFVLMIASVLGLLLGVRAGAGLWVVVAAVTCLGVGQTFIWATNGATAMRDIEAGLMGAASGVYNTARQLGGVIGVAMVGAAMGAGAAAGTVADGVAWAFPVIIAALIAGLVASLFLRPTLEY